MAETTGQRAAQICRDAAEIVARGWCQGRFHLREQRLVDARTREPVEGTTRQMAPGERAISMHPSHMGPRMFEVEVEDRYCLWGALLTAVGVKSNGLSRLMPWRYRTQDPARQMIYRELFCRFPERIEAYANWPGARFNDLKDTTVEDVAKLLLQVADVLEVR